MLLYGLLGAALAHAVVAQTEVETIWSSCVVTLYGDRVPLLAPELSVLTPQGATDLYAAGSLFRNRYISPNNLSTHADTLIHAISQYVIDNTQILAMSLYDVYVSQSATAFMQGLYPPLATSYPQNSSFPNSASLLANGKNVDSPLGNYQYPDIYSAYESDPNYVFLLGARSCPTWNAAEMKYLSSAAAVEITQEKSSFYGSFYDSVFQGQVSQSTLNYSNAYEIWDYVSYAYLHNATVNSRISSDDVDQLRYLADDMAWALNGNTSGNGLTTISGQTMAAQILGDLTQNVQNSGVINKLNLYFTSYEPMMALASLMGLADTWTQFKGMPDLGSSMIFELYSNTNTSTTSNGTDIPYPNPNDLNIRFLFRNGTNSTTNLDEYPLFGNTDSQMIMPFPDFIYAMESIMISEPGIWCSLCGSTNPFCPGYEAGVIPDNSSSSSSSSSPSPLPTAQIPFVAGIIGALIALAIAAILLALAMLLGGLRFMRRTHKRRSDLGGFKGAEKLASDVDLAKGATGAVVGAEVIGKETGGHRRVESWELREGRGRPSFERDNAEGDAGSVFGREATKPDERV